MTRSSPPARRSAAGPARPRTTAARSSTASPRCWRAAGRSSSARSPTPRACRRPRPPSRSTRRSTAGSGTRAGPTRSPRWSAAATRWRARTSTSPPPSRRVWSTVLAPQESSFLGLVSVIAPVIATGNTVVVIASERSPLPALSLGEVLATSDLPGGVVNVLSGRTAEIAAPLAAHQDVNAIDLAGRRRRCSAKELEIAAADNLKRVVRPQPVDNWSATPGIDRLRRSWRRRRSGTRRVRWARAARRTEQPKASRTAGATRGGRAAVTGHAARRAPQWPSARLPRRPTARLDRPRSSPVTCPTTGTLPSDCACATGAVSMVVATGWKSATWVPSPLSRGSTPVPASGLGFRPATGPVDVTDGPGQRLDTGLRVDVAQRGGPGADHVHDRVGVRGRRGRAHAHRDARGREGQQRAPGGRVLGGRVSCHGCCHLLTRKVIRSTRRVVEV